MMIKFKWTTDAALYYLAWLILAFSLVGLSAACKNPEIERMRAAKIEEDRLAAEQEAEEARKKADEEKKKEAESADEKAVSPERQRADAAVKSFRVFLDRIMSDPSIEPRKYVSALRKVAVEGDTLSLSLSIHDKEEARKLCNVALLGWTDRTKHGILHVQVNDAVSDSVLAMSTESGVCE